LAFKPLGQRETLDFTTQFLNPFEPALDLAVEFLAMIPIVRERRKDLSERQVRMLEV